MDDLRILGTKPVPKLICDMTPEEEMEYIQNEYEAKENVLNDAYELDKSCIAYLNQIATIECRNRIPKDPLWVHYSIEAWTINEIIKTILDKFRKFFPKIFNYITGFVILRIKSCKLQCDKWLNIIKDTEKDQSKSDKIFNDSTVKTAKVEFIVDMLNNAASAYNKMSDNTNKLKGLKSIGDSDADKKKLEEMIISPPEYTTFLEKKKLIDDSEPNQDNKAGSTGFTYKDGGWDDPAKIAKLCEALDHVVGVLENIKRLQANCDEMVRDLSKEQKGESAEKNLVKQLNEEKIKFLKKISKDILSSMMSTIGGVGSKAANNCKSFCNKYGSED